MFHYYKVFLLTGLLAFPWIVLVWRNHFDNSKKTILRFGAAVLVAWTYLVMSRYVVVEMNLLLASTQEEVDAVLGGDGAKNLFALYYGWIPGLIITSAAWFVTRSYRWLKMRIVKQPNS